MTDSTGTILKQERETRNLNIAQVTKATRIRAYYIEAMEADKFNELPSPVQARGFLRAYGEFLGLDVNDLLSRSDLIRKPVESQVSKFLKSEADVNTKKLIDPDEMAQSLRSESSFDQSQSNPIQIIENVDDLEDQVTSPGDELEKPSTDAPGKSQQIFRSIGEQLKNQREALSLSMDEVEVNLHVRRHYLESIEAGEFEKLPSTVQARGMLINYARFLDLDQDEILLLYTDGLQAQRIERQPVLKGSSKSTNPLQRIFSLQRYISIDLIFGGGLIILLIIFAFWATGNVINLYKIPVSDATSRSISDIILTPLQTLPSMQAGLTQPALLLTNTPVMEITQLATLPGSVSGLVQVYVIVLQSAWMRVTVDGKIAYEGRVEPGSAYPYNGINEIEILTGNGAALQIIYNQTDLGVMGVFGEVVDRIYTPDSILNPTATITLTPTITPTPTRTPRRSSTPQPTRTPITTATP
jgi:cytoskeletal protein RodZ